MKQLRNKKQAKENKILTEENEIIKRWKQYFQELAETNEGDEIEI